MKKTLKKYFIPHPENDHKPHILRERAVIIIAFFAVFLLIASIVGNYAVKNIPSLASIQSAFLVDLTNEERLEQGLGKLAINTQLVDAAKLKANDMASKSYFAHVSPEGITPWYWIRQAGYSYVYAGENLAVNFNESKDVQRAWMNSPTHKANIISNKYTEIGISTAEGVYKGKKTTFVVQMFGSPKKSTLQSVGEGFAPKVAEASEIETALPNSSVASQELVAVTVDETTDSVDPVDVLSAETNDQETFMSFSNPEATPEELNQIEISNVDEKVVYTNWFERLIVSPSSVISSIYVVLAALVVFSLILKIFIEIRLQHPKNIAYGIILLAIIIIFMYLNSGMGPDTTIVLNS